MIFLQFLSSVFTLSAFTVNFAEIFIKNHGLITSVKLSRAYVLCNVHKTPIKIDYFTVR